MRIPFCPLPVNRARTLSSKKFRGLSQKLLHVFPKLEAQLKYAGIEIPARDYLSIAIFSSLFIFVLVFFAFIIIAIRLFEIERVILTALPVSLVVSLIAFLYIEKYPRLIVKKRVADIERNLMYALKHLYIHVKSGVTVFDAIVSVSKSDYGAISNELKIVVKEVNSGSTVEAALERAALRNPSVFLRRACWQLSEGMKNGSDISIVIKSVIENISAEQRIAVRRYGSQLNPMTLVYMMIAVVIPSLGLTFMIVLSSFSGSNMHENTLWMILVFLALFQFMFLSIIKSKRPNI